MIARAFGNAVICGILGIVGLLTAPGVAQAASTFQVAQGWDVLETDPSDTSIPGLGNLMGVPLNTFNFATAPDGSVVGVQNLGAGDTIIKRLQTATAVPAIAGATATITIQMVALQLETVAPVNFMGLGLNNYFVTLNTGTASTGLMNITWNASGLGGTFTTSLNLDFDVRQGSLSGPIVANETIALATTSATAWSDLPPPGPVTLRDVNRYLSGVQNDPTQDFWINPGPFIEMHPAAFMQTNFENGVVIPAAVPEPSSIVMLSLGILAVVGLARRSRRYAE